MYLGYRVSEDGIIANPAKIKSVFFWSGLIYRQFTKNLCVIVRPMYALSKKEAVFLSDSCAEAFARLKMLLKQTLILAFPYLSSSFRAILSQEQEDGTIQLIVFASRTLQPHEHNYAPTELETLGVVWAVHCLHQ